jgi:O-succinylbenzoic acid--CoA ligase
MYNWLKVTAQKYPNNIALEDEQTSLSYSELDRIVESLKSSLNFPTCLTKYLPIEVSQSITFVIILLVIWRKKLTPILIGEPILNNQIDDILTSDQQPDILSVQQQNEIINSKNSELKIYNELTEKNNEAVVIFTSGSTGSNKGAILTFENFSSSYNSINSFDRYSNNDVFIASLPFYHIGGFSIIVRSILSGAKLIVPKSLKSDSLQKDIVRLNPNYISLVPAQLKDFLDNNFQNYEGLKSIYVGGSSVDNQLIKKAVRASLPIVKVYGSTETCAMITANRINKYSTDLESSGQPLKNIEIRITKSDDNSNLGQIEVNSKSLFKGYLNKYIETDQAFNGEFYQTNDIGFLTPDGSLNIVGRKDDVIISGGKKIIPAEVEEYLTRLENVNETHVFGIKDSRWGQKLCAAVVLKNDLDETEIKRELKKLLPSFKVPKDIYIVESIPRNKIGKIDKNKLELIINNMG